MRDKHRKPVSGTGEWAAHVQNIQNGCEHDCRYCYAKTQAVRFGTNTPEGWGKPVLDLATIESKRFGRRNGTIMFPTTHDITPANIGACVAVLKRMLEAGNRVLIVSKPHLECVREMCSELDGFQDKVLFRFTIGSADDSVLRFWEPNATAFGERLDCLRFAKAAAGYQTSVSCEPMLDAHVELVVEAVRPFVTDAVWIGKPNRLMLRTGSNCSGEDAMTANEVMSRAKVLLDTFTDDFVWALYRRYKDDPMVKWKDSIKQVVGLERPTVKGLDK